MGNVYYERQGNRQVKLLQIKPKKRYEISKIGTDLGDIEAIMNFPFFNAEKNEIVGRYQGDEFNDTVDQTNFNGINLVIFNDNTYQLKKMDSWDYQDISKIAAGMCPSAALTKGQAYDQIEISDTLIAQGQWTPNNYINRVAIVYDTEYIMVKGDGFTARGFVEQIIKDIPNFEFIALGDGGGSSELLIKGVSQGTLSDGGERPNYCGFAFIKKPITPEENQSAMFPAFKTWISQGMNGATSHKGTKAIDFGTWGTANKKRLGLPSEYDYPLRAPFDCKVVYADPVAKGGTVALESLVKVKLANGEYDYLTIISEHSEDRPDKNKTFKQGEIYAHFGKAGGVEKHWHLEVIKGRFSEIYKNKSIAVIKQSVGNVYYFEKTINPNDALFITKEMVIEGEQDGSASPYTWKIIGDDTEDIEKLKKEIQELKETNDRLQAQYDALKQDLEKTKSDLTKANQTIEKVREDVK